MARPATAVAASGVEDPAVGFLREHLRRLDLMIRRVLDCMPRNEGSMGGPELAGLVLTRDEIDSYLAGTEENAAEETSPDAAGPCDVDRRLSRLEAALEGHAEEAWRRHRPMALEWLAVAFALTPFERDVLVVLLAPELDRKYDRLYAYLQDDVTQRRPTVDLVCRLLCRSFAERVTARAFLRRSGALYRHGLMDFLESTPGTPAPLLGRQLQLSDPVVDFLIHGHAPDPDLPGAVRVEQGAPIDELCLPAESRRQLARIVVDRHPHQARHPSSARASGDPVLCRIEGPAGVGCDQAAAALCHEMGLTLLRADLQVLQRDDRLTERLLRGLVRDATLLGAALVLSGVDCVEEQAEPAARAMLRRVLAGCPQPVLLTAEGPESRHRVDDAGTLRVTLPAQDFPLRKAAWRRAGEKASVPVTDAGLERLANRFRLSAGQIDDAMRHAKNLGLLHGKTDAAVDEALLFRACREQHAAALSDLATRIEPGFSWPDIVLTADQHQQLREMCDHANFRQRVMGDWGFGEKLKRGCGLSALFAGPSGTGKTMAAEVVAGELGLDLYKIDLATVVSKYIGETEKNLRQIFDEAENSDAILFFDEADALFGKRSEVKDSHDRYANIEINYLLQRIEEYEGIVILATNLRSHLDDAFTRRLRFSLEFPFPNAALRAGIWRGVLPGAAPRAADIDFGFLAERFELSGGNIRNAALTGAFLAARDGRGIGMVDLVQGVGREYQKMGKLCTRSEFGRYHAQVSLGGGS